MSQIERFKELAGILNEDFKTQAKKFISQGVDPKVVDTYIKKFKQIKEKGKKYLNDEIEGLSVIGNDRIDIDKFPTFKELELFVDYMQGMVNLPDEVDVQETIETDGKPVYKKNGVEIYYADTPRACIKYKGSFPYSWCVARDSADNMFFSYRLDERQPAFYFVKIIDRIEKEFSGKPSSIAQIKDKYHFFVIQVPVGLDPSDKKREQFIVTSAKNDGDTEMSWNDIVKIEPRLKDALSVFQPKPHTEAEEKMKQYEVGLNDEEFAKLPYNDKSLYLDVYPKANRKITDKQFEMLPEDLKNKYLTLRVPLTENQYQNLKKFPKLLSRYHDIVKKKYEDIVAKKSNDKLNSLEWDIVFEVLGVEKPEFIKDLESMDMVDFIVKYAAGLEDVAENSYDDDKLEIRLSTSEFDDLFGSQFYYNAFSGYGAFDNIYVDESEIGYAFNEDNLQKLYKIMKMYGVDPEKYEDNREIIYKFLSNHDMDNLMDDITQEISIEASREAQQNGRNLQMEYPMDYSSNRNGYEITFSRDAIRDFIAKNSLFGVQNLEEFLKKFADIMGDIFSDEAYFEIERNGVYEFDRTYLDEMISEYLDNLLETGVGERYSDILDKLKNFKIDEYNKKEDSRYNIEVTNLNPKNLEDYDDIDDPEVEVVLTDKQEKNKKYKGVVKLSSIPKYMYNYQLFEMRNVIRNIVNELLG